MTTPRGTDLLHDPRRNKSTAFSEKEREALGLLGLLPEGIDDLDTQLRRALAQLDGKTTDLERYIYLSQLQDTDETLFYRVLMSDPARFMPIVYTPTVGEACQKFGHLFRRPRGLYLSIKRKGRLREIVRNWPERDVRCMVVTSGERILGLGDLGANGMGIPIGKPALYTAAGGVPPQYTLPVLIDAGTNNETLLGDPLYLGLKQTRISDDELDAFVDEFVAAVEAEFPGALIQFEDWAGNDAIRLLERYRERGCCFNDDVHGARQRAPDDLRLLQPDFTVGVHGGAGVHVVRRPRGVRWRQSVRAGAIRRSHVRAGTGQQRLRLSGDRHGGLRDRRAPRHRRDVHRRREWRGRAGHAERYRRGTRLSTGIRHPRDGAPRGGPRRRGDFRARARARGASEGHPRLRT